MESMASTLDDVRWPVHTARLSLRPANTADLDATWRFRQLDEFSRWMTSAPTSREDYRLKFEDPERLAKTLVIELVPLEDAVRELRTVPVEDYEEAAAFFG